MLEHGGNLRAASERFGIPFSDWLDLSTGINPHGYPVPDIPPSAWQRLPETDNRLEQAAAHYYGAKQILVTSGSQAAIQALPRLRPHCRVTVLGPMYAEHTHAWQQHGHTVNELVDLPDSTMLGNTEVLILCNPNNPTGRMIAPDQLLRWRQILAARDGWLIVDEAFMDTTPQFSLAASSHLPGLIVLRSLGKFFGLAGARVGFLLAETGLLARCAELLGPWPVSGPARIVAEIALADRNWQQHNRSQLLAANHQLASVLRKYGLEPVNGCALFQWLKPEHAENLHLRLAQLGIWTRYFPSQQGLRLGLPGHAGWSKLETSLKQI
ncbi:threonine-phosphate decarboxylase CobD [Methylobacillus arboreus]|uniref:threonine-phosphate decarboxylase CobD n=1 Tax=Methylobacillus arboreus TaxID=755170 RepID=UPI001E45E6D6|nr:threonine-phosphate decarboxylase CobD [Methylobacillus arboreus]MCB5190102.1 threonine-phosphate decarboxylase CobD [Methylobacillus arboreus]